MRSANCCQLSYITRAGRTTRGKVTMSLWTGMLRSTSFRAMLFAHPTAVDVNRLSCHIAGFVGRKEGDHRADVPRLSRPAQRDLRKDARQEVGTLHHPCSHVG